MYTFHANRGCCKLCSDIDGEHFKVAKMMPGENAPPMHPHCRCSTSAYEDSKEYEAWLDHLANGGTTEQWNKIRYSKGTFREKRLENSDESSTMDLNRNKENTGAFSGLPERMSKKHIRGIAKEYGVDLSGLTLNIDRNEDLLRLKYTGRADPENIGGITFFPNAFASKEELLRTLYHEKVHVEQFKEHGVEFVQNNRDRFETLAYEAEDKFIAELKEKGAI
jgi:hypothetical protein